MGTAASAPSISREHAKRICPPERWAEVEEKWSQLAEDDGTVSSPKAFVTASKLNLGIPGTTVDLSNVGVRALMRFTMDQSQYGNLAEVFRKKEGLDDERRERLGAAAAKALAEFAALTEKEKERVRKQGDMDLYTDVAQKRREVLFVEHAGVSAQLERWWQAAFLYLDKDWNEHLDWEEYKEFHKRLMRLLEGADEMTPQEAEETMRADFKVDAGDDGLVSHEEFRYAVFQLADTWTVSLDGDEYVEFLAKSFDVVFKDLIENDFLRPPLCWRLTLRKGAMVKTSLNEAKTTNAISEIIVAKLKADAAADAKQKPRQPFPQFVLKFFEQSHGIGTKMLLKHFGMFVNGAFALIDDPRSEFHDYALTFGQMAGIHTDSGRVAAFPASASTFMLDYFVAVRPLVGLYRGDRVERSSSLEAVISKGETAAYFGYIVAADARRVLLDHLAKALEVTTKDAIYVAALLAFESMCRTVDVIQHKVTYTVSLSTSMELVALAGVISASVAEERARAAEACDPTELGTQLLEVLATPAHAGQRAIAAVSHEAKAFGGRADTRKASLDMSAPAKALAAAKHASQHRKKRKSRTNLDATGDIAAFAAQHAADAAASECATASFDTQDRATASFAEGRASFASVDTAELSPKQVGAVRSLAGAVAPKVSSARSPRPT
jgi:hypothetical protein